MTEKKNVNVDALFNDYLNAQDLVNEATRNFHAALLKLKEEAGATFTHDGQLYQVRVRNNVPYLTELKCPTGDWLAAARERKMVEAAARAAEKPEETTTLEDKVIEDTLETKTEVVVEAPQVQTVGSDIVIG